MKNFFSTKQAGLFVMILFMTLTACKKEWTYADLIKHPDVLKKEVNRCQAGLPSDNASLSCDRVMTMAENLMAMVNEEQENPEKFGQRVLDVQYQFVKAKEDQDKAQHRLDTLNMKQASAHERQAAQNELDQAQMIYQEKNSAVQIFLAVLSLGSPQ